MAKKLNLKDWFGEFADVAQALADGRATIGHYGSAIFAIFDDGEIFPLDNDTRIRMNADIAYYRRNPDCRILSDYCLSSDESVWRCAVGGIAD